MRRDDLVKALAALPETASLMLTVADLREAMDGEQPAPEPHPAPLQEPPDELLTMKQAAALLGVKVRWVYEHQGELPVVKLGPRTLRVSRRKLERRLARQ